MPLTLSTQQTGNDRYTIHLTGSIDSKTHTIVGSEVDAILKKNPRVIIFNMQNVSFVSSAGINVVLMAEKSLNKTNGKALMVNVPPQIRKVFDIVQALPSQQIFASTEEMDRYLKEIQRKVQEGEIE